MTKEQFAEFCNDNKLNLDSDEFSIELTYPSLITMSVTINGKVLNESKTLKTTEFRNMSDALVWANRNITGVAVYLLRRILGKQGPSFGIETKKGNHAKH